MSAYPIDLPHELHPDTKKLVIEFAQALALKLRKAEVKYGHTNRWLEDYWREQCGQQLLNHLKKGDPIDVAAYCAFMWHHDWPTSINVSLHP